MKKYRQCCKKSKVQKALMKVLNGEGFRAKIRSTLYSDSIILYSRDDSEDSSRAIITTISSLTNDLISSGIPHKGALAFGKMALDNERSSFFGQPIIEAYLLQEELIMYGIVVHSSAEAEIDRLEIQETTVLFDYLCPFKGGSSHHLTIPPIFADEFSNKSDKEEQEALMKGIRGFRRKTSGHIRKYIDNTESFLKKYNSELYVHVFTRTHNICLSYANFG